MQFSVDMHESLQNSRWKFGELAHEIEKSPDELEDSRLTGIFSRIKTNLDTVLDYLDQIVTYDIDDEAIHKDIQASADLVQKTLHRAKILFHELRNRVDDSISQNDDTAINSLREVYNDLGEIYLEEIQEHHSSFTRLNSPEPADQLIQSEEDFRRDRIEILARFLNPSTQEDPMLQYLRRPNYVKRINAGFPVLYKLAENLGTLPSNEVLRHEFKAFFPEISLADFDKALKSPKRFGVLISDATEVLRKDSKKDLATAARILLTMQAKLLEHVSSTPLHQREGAYDIKMHMTEKMLGYVDNRKNRLLYMDINTDAQNHIAEKEVYSGHNVIYIPNSQPPVLDETMEFFKDAQVLAAVELLKRARSDIKKDPNNTKALEEFCEQYKLLSIKLDLSPEKLKELALAEDNDKLKDFLGKIYSITFNDSSVPFKPAAIVHNALARAFAKRVELDKLPGHLAKLVRSHNPLYFDPNFNYPASLMNADFAEFLNKSKPGDEL